MTEVIGTGSPVVTDTGHYFTLEEFRGVGPVIVQRVQRP